MAGRSKDRHIPVLELWRGTMMVAVEILLLIFAALAGYAWYAGDEK
jgi:hypothetical protein